MTTKHGRPCLHLDMEKTTVEEAARRLQQWIADNSISVLNVAGPRQSKDPKTYSTALHVLQATFL